jgi:5'-nucleotidase
MLSNRWVGAALIIGIFTTSAATPATAAVAAKKKVRPLRIMVTNDDGFDAEGLDVLVEALRDLPKVKVTVIAPATNQTATASKTSPSPHSTTPASTRSGYKATAVDGFPADAVNYALEERALKFDLVVSGINLTQNLGPGTALSGTVGAAKQAVAHGVPALAVSQGLAPTPDFETGAREAVKWVKRHRKALLKAKGKGASEASSLNVPTCLTGEVREVVEVPVATGGEYVRNADRVDCESTLEDPPDDVTAFNNGFVTLSQIPPE